MLVAFIEIFSLRDMTEKSVPKPLLSPLVILLHHGYACSQLQGWTDPSV